MTKKGTRCRAADLIIEHSTTEPTMDNSNRTEQAQDDISLSLGYETPGTPDLVEDESFINCNFTSPRKIDRSADFSRYSSTDENSSLESDTAEESSIDSDLESLTTTNSLVIDERNNFKSEIKRPILSNNSHGDSIDSTVKNTENSSISLYSDSNSISTSRSSVDPLEPDWEIDIFDPDEENINNDHKNINKLFPQKVNKETPPNVGSNKIPDQDFQLEESREDKFGCMNIQNQFEYMAATELFVNGEFSYLSFQEPFATHERGKPAWESFVKKELESVKVNSFFSKYQVIFLDEEKWGGKVDENFTAYQNGRVVSIVLRTNDDKFIGLISVYALTHGTEWEFSSNKKIRKKFKTRLKTTDTVEEILEKWQKKYKDICPIIVGDIQETVSTLDRDNIGKYRIPSPKNGILNRTSNSHYSLVRNRNLDTPYITREGDKGGRGIDHILFPIDAEFANLVISADIERQLGERYFPSDHVLLSCKLVKKSGTDFISDREMVRSCYRKIYNIKVKHNKEDNTVTFDETQFSTMVVEKQKELFDELQRITDPNENDIAKDVISKFNKKSIDLFKHIWELNSNQNRKGKGNDLIEFEEDSFELVEELGKEFKSGIEKIMGELKMVCKLDIKQDIKTKRKRIASGNGFKIFDSLPITTKIRYLKFDVRKKSKVLKGIIKNIHRADKFWDSKNKPNKEQGYPVLNPNLDKFITAFHLENLVDKVDLEPKGGEIFDLINQEHSEWDKHIDAILSHKKDNKIVNGGTDRYKSIVDFKLSDDKVLDSINDAMLESECCHLFYDEAELGTNVGYLIKDIDSWKDRVVRGKENILEFDNHSTPNKEFVDAAIEHLSIAKEELDRLYNKLSRTQSWYKNNKLTYYAKINKTGSLAKKLLPLQRDSPKAHTVIWDNRDNCFRNCKDIDEELLATEQYHGSWMSDSKAKENCAFAKVVIKGKSGARGIKLNHKRKINVKDIKNLIHGRRGITEEIKKAFIEAHGKHIADLFREPEKDDENFFYPFFPTNDKGDMNNETELLSKFLDKSLNSIPGKARFDGFHLAILGRFNPAWRKLALNMIKIIFFTRYMPHDFKRIARIPIPKPNAVNEYRPISLCHDLYCFVNGVVANYTTKAIEKANKLPPGVAAYRPGKGCSMLVATEVGVREDCIESNIPGCRLDEDEEKFFDRICLEIILAVLRINGFPNKGFLELKASCMWDKEVDIITNRGLAHSFFKCGLEQGNPDSPKMANLVIKLKHMLWNDLTKKLQDEYKMFSVDEKDGVIKISSTGFSDDNTENNSNQCIDKLFAAIQEYIKLSGDLSMALKIGRKGSKCVIYLYNIPAEKILEIPTFSTIAWSFKDDKPTKEIIPVKVFMQKEEIEKLDKIIKDPDIREKVDAMLDKKDNKHLGIYMDMNAETEVSSKKTLNNAKERLLNLNLYNLNVMAVKTAANMLVTTMHSYAPVQKNHSTDNLLECDKLLSSVIRKTCGFCKTDAQHLLFLSEKNFGHGIKTFQEIDLKANARELEVVLNNSEYDGQVLRSRTAAIKNKISLYQGSQNHVWSAINKLAKFGIFLRDRNDGITNGIMEAIIDKKNWIPVGKDGFKGGSAALLGRGNIELLQGALGSTWYFTIKNWLGGIWTERQISYLVGRNGLKLIKECKSIATNQSIRENLNMLSFMEWKIRKNPYKTNNLLEENTWDNFDSNSLFANRFNSQNTFNWDHNDRWNFIRKDIQLQPLRCVNWSKNPPTAKNDHGEIIRRISESQSPIIIATDGGHENEDSNQHNTSAAIALCILDIKNGETLSSGEWMDRPTIPLLIRTMILPRKIGTCKSDIGHGEAMAACLQEECLPPELARAVILDSTTVRTRMLQLRDTIEIRERIKVRNVFSGIGKNIVSRLNNHIIEWKNEKNVKQMIAKKTLPSSYINFCLDLEKRHKAWAAIMREKQEIGEMKTIWKREYTDSHPIRSLWKIDSHQLNKDGTGIKESKRRYKALTPNLALLNANHWADLGASEALKRTKGGNEANRDTFMRDEDLKYACSEFRFYFSWDGLTVDKSISDFINNILETERLNRLSTKDAHGILCRTIHDSSSKPYNLAFKSGWRRLLLYFTNTHTRAFYKNTDYKNSVTYFIINKILTNDSDEILHKDTLDEVEVDKASLLKCAWCNLHWKKQNQDNNCIILKGNRRHMLLFCENKRISAFRKFMADLIEAHILILHKNIQYEVGIMKANIWLYKIQDVLLHLQSKNTGRKKLYFGDTKDGQIVNYLPIRGWLKKLSLNSIEEGISDNQHILSHIMGLRHALGDGLLQDNEHGMVDCIILGIIPKDLDNCIKDSCKLAVDNSLSGKDRKDKLTNLLQLWKDITKLIRINAIGIHRICNCVAKDFKSECVNKFNVISEKRKRILTSKKDYDSDLEEKSKPDAKHQNNTKAIIANNTHTTFKACNGIKCGHMDTLWSINDGFKPKRISNTMNQCQACNRLKTAANRFFKVINSLNNNSKDIKCSIIELLDKIASMKKPYTIGIHVNNFLTTNITGKERISLMGKNKKISDSVKLTMRMLGQLLGGPVTSIFDDDLISRIRSEYNTMGRNNDEWDWIKFCTNILCDYIQGKTKVNHNSPSLSPSIHESTVKECKKRSYEVTDLLADSNTTPPLQLRNKNKKITKLSSNIERKLKSYIDIKRNNVKRKTLPSDISIEQIKDGNNLLGSSTADYLLDIIRYNFALTNKIYIAGAYTSSILMRDNNNQWDNFGNLFRNDNATQKEEGLYIIPVFIGSINFGHWFFNIIHWNNNECKGWTFDSLANPQEEERNNVRNRIINHFGRDNLVGWEEVECTQQTEVECGPRMIWGIASFCKLITEGEELHFCIDQVATIEHTPRVRAAATVRRKVTELLELDRSTGTNRRRRRRYNKDAPDKNNSNIKTGKIIEILDA